VGRVEREARGVIILEPSQEHEGVVSVRFIDWAVMTGAVKVIVRGDNGEAIVKRHGDGLIVETPRSKYIAKRVKLICLSHRCDYWFHKSYMDEEGVVRVIEDAVIA
jgi:hypothetical protein